MAETMEREQFDAQLPKIITGILAAYKKDKIHLPITQVGASATVLQYVDDDVGLTTGRWHGTGPRR